MTITATDYLEVVNDGTSYELETNVGSMRIGGGATSGTATFTAYCYKREGDGERVAHPCFFTLYRRTGTSLAYLSRGSSSSAVSNCTFNNATADSTVNAFVVFATSTRLADGASAPTAYLAKCEIPIVVNGADGAKGESGHIGRFYYYAGEWSQDGRYRMEETQAPFVKHDGGFWMLDYRGVEPSSLPYPSGGQPGEPSTSSMAWTQMSSQQQYYIAKAFFGEYAQFGSFIINGDWMLSTQGTVNGAASSRYVDFNPQNPMESVSSVSVSLASVNLPATKVKDSVTVWMEEGKTYTISFWHRYTSGSGTANQRIVWLGIIDPDNGDSDNHSFTSTSQNATEPEKVSYLALHTGNHLLEFSHASGYYAHSITGITVSHYNFVPNFAVDGLTGETYQNTAHVRGEVHATSGEFSGAIHATSGDFDGALMSVDGKVAVCGTELGNARWRGVAVGSDPSNPYTWEGTSTDFATFGARFSSDGISGYGRIVTTKDGSQNMVVITSADANTDIGGRVTIHGGDGSVTCEKLNVTTATILKGTVALHGALKTVTSGTVTLPSNPEVGQMVFVKGTSGDVTSVSGNGKKIMKPDSNTESNSLSDLGKNSAIFIFDGERWIAFWCG